MTVKLKVCGMREAENILSVALLEPAYMGFIFYDKSPRFVGENFIIPKNLPTSIAKVGVFVNALLEDIVHAVQTHSLDFVQLHGDETPDFIKQVKEAGVRVIKAFAIGEGFSWSTVKPYAPWVDYFLFDTKGENYGGNGRTFDWSILNSYPLSVPFFLSGGINEENVKKLAGVNKPVHAIDVNSGVEEKAGVKSVSKIEVIKDLLHEYK